MGAAAAVPAAGAARKAVIKKQSEPTNFAGLMITDKCAVSTQKGKVWEQYIRWKK